MSEGGIVNGTAGVTNPDESMNTGRNKTIVPIADARERETALDPARSFIVQAPAGSGKTELLVRRVLRLLAIVEEPEEILAITFTRKAAGEMRARILAALRAAREKPRPDDPYEASGWDLARAVTLRDESRGWSLAEWPSRLRIMTIDAFNGSLTRLLPRLSGVGAQPEVADDAEELYRAAVATAFRLAQEEPESREHFRRLLLHLGNRMSRLEDLLLGMLAKRDQWVDKVLYDSGELPLIRSIFESALRRAIGEGLREAAEAFPKAHAADLLELARYSAENREAGDWTAAQLRGMDGLPGTSVTDAARWRALADLLLTGNGDWRKKVDKRNGFPPADKEMKNRMTRLLDALREDDRLGVALAEIRELPAPEYTDAEWRIVESATKVLKLAAASLQLAFSASGVVDHIYIALAAQRALGEEERPTDLALALDHRISHILVDEFQDTSALQFRLIGKLTAGWTPDDGRTLFLVGDPMQSIYRFREAEVGLFLKAKEEGIGSVKLEPLTLQVNFRSRAGIVEWVNEIFPEVLSAGNDSARGAVAYSRSVPFHPAGATPPVILHAFAGRRDEAEAQAMLAVIRETRASYPSKKIAILVRTRNHLLEIVPLLRAEELPFRAVEIEALGERQILLDLLSLTRALLHPADRLAWFSILRAPWCGLLLADLLQLARRGPRTIPDALGDEEILSLLSPDGSLRAARFRDTIAPWRAQAGRIPLRRLVEGAWLSLGGPLLLDAIDFADAQVFLSLLEECDAGGTVPDWRVLHSRIDALKSGADPAADDTLQIMTIHKAKGLEFDAVLLPGLGKKPRSREQELMLWDARIGRDGPPDLLMAPIPARGGEDTGTYDFIRKGLKEKDDHETGRLMYVAATRARESLHLFAHFPLDNEGNPKPEGAANSFLSKFPSTFRAHFASRALSVSPAIDPSPSSTSSPDTSRASKLIHRIQTGFTLPSLPPPVELPRSPVAATEQKEIRIFTGGAAAKEETRKLGIVLHGYLELIAREGLGAWTPARIDASREVFIGALQSAGVPAGRLPASLEQLTRALRSILSDEQGRWILSPHESAETEFSLTGMLEGKLRTVRLDRTFVENGIRWIVDYKTGAHEGADPERWLDQQVELYRPDLLRYAELMRLYDPRPVKIGIYFTLPSAWREVS